MLTRMATRDDAPEVIPLLLEAIGDIAYLLTGASDESEAAERLTAFYNQPGNRVSCEHVLVAEQEGRVAGMLVAYSGNDAHLLDEPFLVESHRRASSMADSAIVREAQDGEYYLDALAVAATYRGQGIAKQLMTAAELRAAELGFDRTALIVEAYNDRAYKLYIASGYTETGTLRIGDSDYRRMVKLI
ncbi:GNAT family N-acetyltransferase [Paenibacillus albus]|uniref:GNAT family N-acetyltransferase n=1 Tax=Paenibacillus albus TaxID=2495582 RepID=A0A3S9A7X1_9BACL|nr:GNAT family N-acetyltransferase [Paenibacillus albus]AZN41793.1 GNAT family N-acetyltransferase [Paenibacillus albus]